MATIVYVIAILCFLLVIISIAKSLYSINELDKRIDEIIDEEKRQNKRIENLEKRELIRQLEERHDKAYVEAKDLFKKW